MRLVLLSLLATLPAAAVPPAFDVTLDRAAVAVGDRVVATYSARIPAGATLRVESLVTPAPAAALPGGGAVLEFEPLGPPRIEKEAGAATKESANASVTWRQSVAFAPFASGDLTLPGPHLVFVAPSGEKESVRPPAAALHVASRLPKTEKREEVAPKADRGTRIPSRGPWFWGSVGLLALLLGGAIAWLVTRRRKPNAAGEAAPPALPPGLELLAALEALSRQAEALGDDPRDFYSELTRAVKRYLERRLDQPVLEWTTFETLRRLRDQGLEMPREIAFSELLSAADRVKFGKAGSTRHEAEQHLGRARLVHDHLEARLAPPPVPSAAPAPERSEKKP